MYKFTIKYLVIPIAVMFFASCHSGQVRETKPVKIIFDSDMGPDYDDVGALTMLHAFADSGKAEILATMASNRYELVATSLDVINTYFSRPSIPIGSPKTHGVNIGCGQHWTDSLASSFPHKLDSTAQAQDAVLLYRQILSSQPDTSLVIVTVGFLTNLNDLLLSQPDYISPLSGKELVVKKVKKWVAMAGKFPEGSEFNVKEDSVSSKYVFENWPTQVILSGFEIGDIIFTGKDLIKTNLKSPAKMAFKIAMNFSKEDLNGRQSWDETAVLTAVKGVDFAFDQVKGLMIAEPSGYNKWQNQENGQHSYLVFKQSPDEIAKLIEKYIMHDKTSNQ